MIRQSSIWCYCSDRSALYPPTNCLSNLPIRDTSLNLSNVVAHHKSKTRFPAPLHQEVPTLFCISLLISLHLAPSLPRIYFYCYTQILTKYQALLTYKQLCRHAGRGYTTTEITTTPSTNPSNTHSCPQHYDHAGLLAIGKGVLWLGSGYLKQTLNLKPIFHL